MPRPGAFGDGRSPLPGCQRTSSPVGPDHAPCVEAVASEWRGRRGSTRPVQDRSRRGGDEYPRPRRAAGLCELGQYANLSSLPAVSAKGGVLLPVRPEHVRDRFGPARGSRQPDSPSDSTTSNGLLVPATGTVSKVDAAFSTTIAKVRLPTGGSVTLRWTLHPSREPWLPKSPGCSGSTISPSRPNRSTPIFWVSSRTLGAPSPRKADLVRHRQRPRESPCHRHVRRQRTQSMPSPESRATPKQPLPSSMASPISTTRVGWDMARRSHWSRSRPTRPTRSRCSNTATGSPILSGRCVVDGGGGPYQEGEAALDIEQVAALAPGSEHRRLRRPGIDGHLHRDRRRRLGRGCEREWWLL